MPNDVSENCERPKIRDVFSKKSKIRYRICVLERSIICNNKMERLVKKYLKLCKTNACRDRYYGDINAIKKRNRSYNEYINKLKGQLKSN